jgi:hypothetical protein
MIIVDPAVMSVRAALRRGVTLGILADSGALRARRARLHKAGDHSLCRRCDGRSAVAVLPAAGAAGDTGVDPGVALGRLAARLEAAHEADPADAAVARVLKDTLLALRGQGESADSELTGFLAEFRRA